ncbi:trigger factor [Ruficoccus sp. ZRK36]|uniref:trigger factor n=1 Tax=Ruficoccus sp. ZRK36 TaxID=2866311 RepID=UPI001C7339FC|nr:trigger factor [Ruficoccus sp. ZRK36]QYY36120.1 trigger factor [Ruficoccus sp. ZRK36]
MNIQVEDINDTRKLVTVSVTRDEIAEKEASLLADFAKQARLPGFRPGKAPTAMVKKRYAKEIQQEVRQKLVSEAYSKALEDSGLNVISLVELADPEFPEEGDTAFKFTLDIKPEFELPEYKGLELSVPKSDVTDHEVEHARDHILGQRAEFNVVEQPAKKGDYVKVSYEGKIGDELVADLAPDQPIFGTQKNTWEEAGAEHGPGVKAVVEGIVGMKAGDVKDAEETFPEEYEIEALKGKTVSYHIEVHEVRERILPEINEEFLKTFQVETEEEFNNRIRDDIKSQKEQQAEQAKREQAATKLSEKVEFPLPESLVEGETQDLLRDFMQRGMAQGATQEQFEERKDELYKGAREAAEKRVKAQMLLTEVAKKEEFKVENEDLNRAIYMEAMSRQQKPDDLVKELQKDRQRVVEMQRNILVNKALDFLVKEATVTETEPEEAHSHSH